MIVLRGSKKDGFIIEAKDKNYKWDIQLTYNELLELKNKLNKIQ